MNTDHLQLIVRYQNGDNLALERLLECYEKLLHNLAHKHSRKFPNTLYDDNLQNARVGAILAFKRYDTKHSTKVITFVYKTVAYYLLDCNDAEAFIKCPSNLRSQRHEHKTLGVIETFDEIPELLVDGESQIVDEVCVKVFVDSLPPVEKDIVILSMQGHPVTKIAEIVSRKYNKNYSRKQIQKNLTKISTYN